MRLAEGRSVKNNKLYNISASLIVVFALSLVSATVIRAQSGTTSVSGTVFDQERMVVVGAAVTLSNAEKNFSRTVTSNENGIFSFPVIQPGVYRLEVEMRGFKKFVNNEVRTFVDSATEISAVLEVGNINEVVNMQSTAAEALLNTQDATIGNPFNSDQVTQLPTEARDVINLLTLQPGVTRFGYVAGGRSDQANITLDGVDINEAQTNNIFEPVLRLNAEAIEEFRVTTSNPNASQGRSSGAEISLVTKGGTNQLRGALFLTGRRTGWTANDFFNNKAGVERPKFDRDVFGGAIGGPVWKDRVFFFYSYEGERTTQGQTVVRVVPLPIFGQGLVRFSNTNGEIDSLSCADINMVFPNTHGCNPMALSIFADAALRYPANSFDVGDSTASALKNTAGFRFNANNEFKKNSQVLRLDANLSFRQQVFFRFNYIDDTATSAPQFPDTPTPSVWRHPYGFAVGHNWTISSRSVNSFRFGLTRDAFSNQGDSSENSFYFGGVYIPRTFQRSLERVTPFHNITDDISWIWRSHTFQIGTNISLVRNRQEDFASAYDYAATEPGYYAIGSVVGMINTYLGQANRYGVDPDRQTDVLRAVTAAVGRLNSYGANYTFSHDGLRQSAGTPIDRDFRNEEYDLYVQDIWKVRPNLTITAGLRYGLSRPVYEANGYETRPAIGLSDYFERRAAGAANSTPYNEPIVIDLSGPANGKPPLYNWDKNNFQPRVAAAWSPNFGEGRMGWLFGRNNESVIRGGFAVTNDHFGQQMAASFDYNNLLGFVSTSEIRANKYNLTTRIAPLFTGYGQSIRNLPNIIPPAGNLTFPRQAPILDFASPIEGGLDADLVSPINYSWSLTYERTLRGSLIVSASYIGRKARNLLQLRDAAAIANFVDPQSGMDWYTAATQLEVLRQQGTPVSQIQQIPYFANLFPADLISLLNVSLQTNCSTNYNQTQAVYAIVAGADNCAGTDWTTAQLTLSTLSTLFPGEHIFSQPQYGYYAAWSTIGRSDYQGMAITVRQRLGRRLTMDFNYTLSKSMDDGSAQQTASVFGRSGFIINPFRQGDLYAASDFDMRHIVNTNAIYQLPVGRGEAVLGKAGKLTNLFVGGWQLAGIFRYNSGLPVSAPREGSTYTTNWLIQSYATRTRDIKTCPTRGGGLFGCNPDEAYRSFRRPYPGESGERNVFRLPGYWAFDLGLGKSFGLRKEGHKLQFRWEVFNVTNTQKMGGLTNTNYVIDGDPQTATAAPENWANFRSIQGTPRSMQFVLRYSF